MMSCPLLLEMPDQPQSMQLNMPAIGIGVNKASKEARVLLAGRGIDRMDKTSMAEQVTPLALEYTPTLAVQALRENPEKLQEVLDSTKGEVTLSDVEAEHKAVLGAYNELLYQVENKYPDETRHQTALRTLREASQLIEPKEERGPE